MKRGRYKLAKASGDCCHFADVSVSIIDSSSDNRIINKSDAPAQIVAGASLGIEHELTKAKGNKEVVIESIQFTLADSSPEAVAYASSMAVREALNLEDSEYPKLSGGEIYFKQQK